MLTNLHTHQELEIEYRVVESDLVTIDEAEERPEPVRDSHAEAVNVLETSVVASTAQPVRQVAGGRTLVARTVCQNPHLGKILL